MTQRTAQANICENVVLHRAAPQARQESAPIPTATCVGKPGAGWEEGRGMGAEQEVPGSTCFPVHCWQGIWEVLAKGSGGAQGLCQPWCMDGRERPGSAGVGTPRCPPATAPGSPQVSLPPFPALAVVVLSPSAACRCQNIATATSGVCLCIQGRFAHQPYCRPRAEEVEIQRWFWSEGLSEAPGAPQAESSSDSAVRWCACGIAPSPHIRDSPASTASREGDDGAFVFVSLCQS